MTETKYKPMFIVVKNVKDKVKSAGKQVSKDFIVGFDGKVAELLESMITGCVGKRL